MCFNVYLQVTRLYVCHYLNARRLSKSSKSTTKHRRNESERLHLHFARVISYYLLQSRRQSESRMIPDGAININYGCDVLLLASSPSGRGVFW